ncbi:MFS general substrate transporter [Corynespora cassiicola Philippines]|uniref:MFS general substrate transporter n=1 Tax=Corynespora cassiicola Philippines TaxID=1448308 RepID=A0A2T2P9Z0_CORCC|nr:MFS general substrate transporter [Corynespora cassiicola Philippines]
MSDLRFELLPPDELVNVARKYFEENELGEVVTKEEFILGVLAFQNQHAIDSLKHEELDPNSPLRPLQMMTRPQEASIEMFFNGTYDGNKEPNIIKKFVFGVIDICINPFQPHGNGRSNWDHIKALTSAQWIIICTCALASIAQGWDQSSMNGANISWQEPLGLDRNRPNQWIWVFGCMNAAPFFSGALIGSLISDPLINEGAFGRRWAIIFGGFFSTVSVLIPIWIQNWQSFLSTRVLLGIGYALKKIPNWFIHADYKNRMGAKASVVPIYISEIAPFEIRGMLTMGWQLFDTLGIFLGSLANFIIYKMEESNPDWRAMIALSFIPALLFLSLAIFCVESPRWLLKHGNSREALRALIRLHDLPSPIIACGELYYTFYRLKKEEIKYFRKLSEHPWYKGRLDAGKDRGKDVRRKSSHVLGSETQNQIINRANDYDLGPIQEASARSFEPIGVNSIALPDSVSSYTKLKKATFRERLYLLFLVQRIKNALHASICVMLAQQACGINILAFMSSIIIAKHMNNPTNSSGSHEKLDALILLDDEKKKALTFSLIFGAINHVGTWIAIPLIDRKGRRALLKISFPLMITFLSVAGFSLLIDDQKSRLVLFEVSTLFFTAAFSVGEGPAAFVIPAEVFPLIVRELGMSQATSLRYLLISSGLLFLASPFLL